MRTVHHTYRRKVKIPKEFDISDRDVVQSKQQQHSTPEKKELFKPQIDTSAPSSINLKHLGVQISVHQTKPTVRDTRDVTESIKQELGLSSVITLQKISKPVSEPVSPAKLPKLTYHGPKGAVVGSKIISPPPPSPLIVNQEKYRNFFHQALNPDLTES